MIANFLQRLFDPRRTLKPLPPPHQSARIGSLADGVLRCQNAERAKRQSINFNKPPSVQTAQEAVAWTFGLEPDEYQPELET